MSRAVKLLLLAFALTASACASDDRPPLEVDAPKLPTMPAALPYPPQVISMPEHKGAPPPKDGIVRLTKAERVGASWHVPAGEDRVYRVKVGAGGPGSGPQQIAVELPEGEVLQFVTIANPDMLWADHVKTGDARDWRWTVFFKPLGPSVAHVENVSILTNKGHYRVDVRVVPGRVNNMNLKLVSADGGESDNTSFMSGIAADALCMDNNFSYQKGLPASPMNVCVLAAPNGIYQTRIQMPPNVSEMPVVRGWSPTGDGGTVPGLVNYKVLPNRMIVVDGVHPGLSLSGSHGRVDIIRGGSS